MVLAVEQCHKLGFIHRDIKPDVGISARPSHFPWDVSAFRSERNIDLYDFLIEFLV